MVRNNVLLFLHPSKWHVEEQGRFKTKKYYHRVSGPIWMVVVTGILMVKLLYDYVMSVWCNKSTLVRMFHVLASETITSPLAPKLLYLL